MMAAITSPTPTQITSMSTTDDPDLNCTVIPCANGGTCLSNGKCQCDLWHSGKLCTNLTMCPDDYCDSSGGRKCTVEDNTPVCHCWDDYLGERCKTKDLCYLSPCKNNGTCTFAPPTITCHCVTGDPYQRCALNRDDGCTANPPDGSDSYITCIDLIEVYIPYRMICRPGRGGIGCAQDHIDPTEQCRGCEDEGFCKPLCNFAVCNTTANCNFTTEPSPVVGNCLQTFADGYYDDECDNEQNLFDGFDGIRGGLHPLPDCSPFFNTICTQNASDGYCNKHCNNSACLWDGLDCIPGRETLQTLEGALVVDFVDNRSIPYSQFGLLLRSGVLWRNVEGTTSLYMKIADPRVLTTGQKNESTVGQFTSIQSVGRFLSMAVAKLPLNITGVTDVWVCDAGTYSSRPGDHCGLPCPAGCRRQGDICHWRTASCLHGCEADCWGDTCNRSCPAGCGPGGCDDEGHCIACVRGKYGSDCQMDCDDNCITVTCDMKTGRCNCGTNRFWFSDTSKCTACSSGCIGGSCSGFTGECLCSSRNYGKRCHLKCHHCDSPRCRQDDGYCQDGCEMGYHGDLCDWKCPQGCTECERITGQCGGNCKPGHVGNDCLKSTEPSSGSNTGAVVAVVLAIIIAIVIIIIVVCYCRKRMSGDYILEDEINSPVPEANTLDVKNNVGLQPVPHAIGASADMIDMDEKIGSSVYAGPERSPSKQTALNVSVSPSVTISDETKLISEGKEITFARQDDVIVTVDVSNGPPSTDGLAEEGHPLTPDGDPDIDGPPVSPGLFLSAPPNRAPLASEEDLTAASLEDVAKKDEPTSNTEVTGTDQDSDKGDGRKTSSSSSSSSKSSADDETEKRQPETEI